jgi:hypothetical protein
MRRPAAALRYARWCSGDASGLFHKLILDEMAESVVALSRHRDNATVFYATEDFGGRRPGATPESVHERFAETLSRARPKELAHDYLERQPSDAASIADLVARDSERARTAERQPEHQPRPHPTNDIDARQQAAAERWAARQKSTPTPGQGTAHRQTHTPRQPHPTKRIVRRNSAATDRKTISNYKSAIRQAIQLPSAHPGPPYSRRQPRREGPSSCLLFPIYLLFDHLSSPGAK